MNPTDFGSGWLLDGRYRVLERIGTGGMAEVFRAHDEVLARDVAVKVFRRVSLDSDTATGVERQRIELQALARLAHPNLITLFDGSLGSDAGPAYLVLELIDGSTLADSIARDAVSHADVRAIGAQIAAALAYVHSAGMVHRDVKPANILLGTDVTSGGRTVRARLSDFGIVRLIGDEGLTGTQFTLGTASYLAPEQARGSSVGPPADVYALGLVLLEGLTRVRAFDGTPLDAVLQRLNRDPEIPGNLPRPWPAMLAAMTARDPAGRPSAQQVVDGLRTDGNGIDLAPTTVVARSAPGAPPGLAAPPVLSSVTSTPPMLTPVPTSVAALAPYPAPTTPGAPVHAPDRRNRHPTTLEWLVIAAVIVVLVGFGVALLLGSGGSATPSPGSSAVTSAKPRAPSSSASTAGESSVSRSTSRSSKSRSRQHGGPKPSTRKSHPPKVSASSPPTTVTSSSPTTSATSTSAPKTSVTQTKKAPKG